MEGEGGCCCVWGSGKGVISSILVGAQTQPCLPICSSFSREGDRTIAHLLKRGPHKDIGILQNLLKFCT